MCGRLKLSRWDRYDAERFSATWDDEWTPRYNLAPTDPVVAIRQDPRTPERRAEKLRWGLVPPWSPDTKGAARMINARAETVATSPAFKGPFRSQRCLVVADGFYEWKRTGATKQAFCFRRPDGTPFALAGLWECWRAPKMAGAAQDAIETCTVFTTTPNAVAAQVHDRMPVVLSPKNFDLWLDPGFHHVEELQRLLVPCDAAVLESYPVGPRVNSVRNDDAACAEPMTLPASLF